MFKNRLFSLKERTVMNQHCPHCQLRFEIEPGFFWGAMYFSYAFSVAITVIIGFLTFFLFNDPDILVYLGIIIPAMILFSPVSLRYSRVLMLYMFGEITYNPTSSNLTK